MIEDYRRKHPGDPRPDRELIRSLMDAFVEDGIIEKRDGKYLIGRIA